MAERRMIAKTIVDSDAFLDMPVTAQNLYFHLNIRADDDGFVNNPRSIMRLVKASDDDMKVLILKKFVIWFNDKGILVIKHWRIHNYIAKDRYKETKYKDEKASLMIDENNAYTTNQNSMSTECIQDVYECETQVRLGKDRLGKDRLDKNNIKEQKHKYGEYKHVLLTDDEHDKLFSEFGSSLAEKAITYLDEYMEMKGKTYKSCYLAIRKWVIEAVKAKSEGKADKTNFNNYGGQRKYDYGELEKKLLGWDE